MIEAYELHREKIKNASKFNLRSHISVHLLTTDGRRATWFLGDYFELDTRGRALIGLAALRDVSIQPDPRDEPRTLYYTMPYTLAELELIFGNFVEKE